jgi:hypothetical protein
MRRTREGDKHESAQHNDTKDMASQPNSFYSVVVQQVGYIQQQLASIEDAVLMVQDGMDDLSRKLERLDQVEKLKIEKQSQLHVAG